MPYCTLNDGAKLSYESCGRGNPLLFIHGWSFNSTIWEDHMDYLKDQFQVIAVDLRGHGKSEKGEDRSSFQQFASDLNYMIKRLELNKVNVVGWSMGGSVAIRLFFLCPEQLQSLTLVSATPSLIQREGFPHALPLGVVKRLKAEVKRDHRKALKAFRDLILSPEEEGLDTIDTIKNSLRHGLNGSRETAENSLVSLMEEDLRDSLGSISLPTLIIHGDRDQICLPGAAVYLNEKVKGSKLLMLKECGHAPFLTYPLQFRAGLTRFLHSL
jgi:pimeloyl-[acyl-carrier protein] methyl ester esterase